MTKYSRIGMLVLIFAAMTVFSTAALGQVTTAEIVGSVTDQAGAVVSGATVTAVHLPSGTKYTTSTNDSGRYTLPALRIGGPYTVTVSQTGFEDRKQEGIQLGLGLASTVDFVLGISGATAEVTVTSDETFSEARTGASTSVPSTVINTLPTINRSAFIRALVQAAQTKQLDLDSISGEADLVEALKHSL